LPILSLPHLKLDHKGLYPRAFALSIELGIDYIDAYNAALMEQKGMRDILSFDRDFDAVGGINRHEAPPTKQ
jgi:predicted nucleic acid-binding protein